MVHKLRSQIKFMSMGQIIPAIQTEICFEYSNEVNSSNNSR